MRVWRAGSLGQGNGPVCVLVRFDDGDFSLLGCKDCVAGEQAASEDTERKRKLVQDRIAAKRGASKQPGEEAAKEAALKDEQACTPPPFSYSQGPYPGFPSFDLLAHEICALRQWTIWFCGTLCSLVVEILRVVHFLTTAYSCHYTLGCK